MPTFILALGTNLGNWRANLRRAFAALLSCVWVGDLLDLMPERRLISAMEVSSPPLRADLPAPPACNQKSISFLSRVRQKWMLLETYRLIGKPNISVESFGAKDFIHEYHQ